MAVSLAIFVLFLKANLIFGFILFNNKEFLWPVKYYDSGEILAFKTTNKSTSECTIKFCKIPQGNNSQEDPLILTPLIEKGETEKAKNLSIVDPTLFDGINSHAAYFTVNETNKWHLFFWYFPAQEVVLENTPLIIWLQGGPGASSLFGLFEEIGPIQIENGTVTRRTINWGSNYSLLFIDNPVGTGFSFTENHDLYATNEDMVGECLLNFLQQFLQVFPELRKAPLFIAGESYAGKYIPAFGHYIHHNKNTSMPINLKGLAIGNGWIDPPTQIHYSEWALQVGLIDPEQAKKIQIFEGNAMRCWDKHNMTCFMHNAREAFFTLKEFAPVSSYNYIKDSTENMDQMDFALFLNEATIQRALHVKMRKYYPINLKIYFHMYHTDLYYTVKPWLEELVEYYGVMCYSGQLDVIVAYAISVHTYRSLNWSGQQAYLNASRVPIYDETNSGKVNSFVKASGNLLDVMVRSAGHMVPSDQPRAAKQIIDMFIKKFK